MLYYLVFSRHGIAQELLGAEWTCGGRREILVCSGLSGGMLLRGHLGQGTTSSADGRVLAVGKSLRIRQRETTSCPWC